jgi:acyl-CoA dehydrogenase
MRDPRCKILIVMGKTDPDGRPHRQQSMVLVPRGHPGRDGRPQRSRCSATRTSTATARSRSTDVRVPASNLIANEGDGFMIAQARLGPGRIHHCMRAIGGAERALELMCKRACHARDVRQAVSPRANIQDWIAESRIEIEHGPPADAEDGVADGHRRQQGARTEIAAIKVAAPAIALRVIDRAIQVHGGGRRQRRLPARLAVRAPAHAAPRRRAPRTRCTSADVDISGGSQQELLANVWAAAFGATATPARFARALSGEPINPAR